LGRSATRNDRKGDLRKESGRGKVECVREVKARSV
jgi:hypothetical protein